jgi:hypothetical protein
MAQGIPQQRDNLHKTIFSFGRSAGPGTRSTVQVEWKGHHHTRNNTGMIFNVALNYGRREIVP